jgi:4-hydroxythreonine-4-phosphate dehydrogenase
MRRTLTTSSSGAGPVHTPRIALTAGEPAGVGPDLCLELARRAWPCELVCLADRHMLQERARRLGLTELKLRAYRPDERRAHLAGELAVLDCPLAEPAEPGRLSVRNAASVLAMLDRAIDGCLGGEFQAMSTAPVQKSIIEDAGFKFSGHTEYLAARTRAARPVMMLAAGEMRVALATTHLPLRDVSEAVTPELLCEVLEILDRDLKRWWRLSAPRIAVCGLNPHAGEGGHLGDEEIRIITPALERMRARGLDVSGPLPADTVFVPRLLERYDAVLAMYHDQGLPVIKHAHFESTVNVTLGLPIVRTSVDHGTALDLAGTGRADARSLEAAVRLAIELAARAP